MGHNQLDPLPCTKPWADVVALIDAGAEAAQVANAAIAAVEQCFLNGGRDTGLVETVWLLMKLPFAARTDDFAAALRECGLDVTDAPDLFEVAAALSDAVDASMPNCRGRTDLGEMAQMAAAETLTGFIGERLTSLFDTSPEDVRRAFARLATSKQFGAFARHFYARLTYKALDNYLSRVLPVHVGEGARFPTLADQGEFEAALDLHCRESAEIVERFAGKWLMKHNWELDGEITREKVEDFTSYAMKKMTDELRQRADGDAP